LEFRHSQNLGKIEMGNFFEHFNLVTGGWKEAFMTLIRFSTCDDRTDIVYG
jgi:hypothetical protein